MVHKMRDLDQGYDYEVLNKKTRDLRTRKHRFLNPDNVDVKGRRGHGYCWPIVGLLTIAWVLFLALWLYTRSQGVHMFAVTMVTHVKKFNPAILVRIPPALANKDGAYCLDGTVPSYYFRKGKGKGERSWIMYLHGGGWCWDLSDCYNRSFTFLGSSSDRYLPPEIQLNGSLSDNPHVNPDFHDWNVAQVNYCDGAAFSGNIPYPVSYGNQTLYFRGSLVLDLVINYLVQSGGLGDADRIILSGSSAGASAVVLHIDHIKTLLPPGIPLHGLVDAGLFLDAKNMTNFDHFRICTQRVYNLQQVLESLNEDCVKDQPQDTRWKCFFSEYAYKYVQTPIFYMNTAFDRWQLWFILEMHCHPTVCPQQLPLMLDFHQKFKEFVKEIPSKSKKNGIFISSCYAHSQAYDTHQFLTYKVAGKTPQEAFGDWYFERVPEGSSVYFDCEDSYDCNPTCDWSLEFYNNSVKRLKASNKCVL